MPRAATHEGSLDIQPSSGISRARLVVWGRVDELDPALLVPDTSIGLGEGAIEAWRKSGRRLNNWYGRQIRNFCDAMDVEKSTPVDQFTEKQHDVLFNGTRGQKKRGVFHFEGILPNLQRRLKKTESELVRERIRSYMSSSICPDCNGARLRPEALHVMLPTSQGPMNITGGVSVSLVQPLLGSEGQDAGMNMNMTYEEEMALQTVPMERTERGRGKVVKTLNPLSGMEILME